MTDSIFTEDLVIARKLILRDKEVTRDYLYSKCYPLFKSIFNNFYTDCSSCYEFINQMYVVMLAPSKITGHCQMENYRGEGTLTSWIGTACIYYCYGKFKKKNTMPLVPIEKKDEENNPCGDIINDNNLSVLPEINSLAKSDVECILGQMTSRRYRMIIQLRYLEHYSNEETAKILGMTMRNYYNKHRLAKQQLINILKEEESYEK